MSASIRKSRRAKRGRRLGRIRIAASLALLMGVLGLLSTSCSEEKGVAGTVRLHALQAGAGVSPAGKIEPEKGKKPKLYTLTPTDCLVQDEIKQKVLIKERNAFCVDGPTTRNMLEAPLKFFRVYFVFDVYPKKPKDHKIQVLADGTAVHGKGDRTVPIKYYKIGSGSNSGSVIGWVDARHATLWSTTVGLEPFYFEGNQGRVPTIWVFETREDLIEFIKTGTSSNPPMTVIRPFIKGRRKLMAWPIIGYELFEHGGKRHELVQLDFLLRAKAGGASRGAPAQEARVYSGRERRILVDSSIKVDIVFVIDTTHSMQPYINAVKEFVAYMAEQLSNQGSGFKPHITFSLVAYRDYVKGLGFITKRYCSLQRNGSASSLRFLEEVKSLKEADAKSVDWPEAVYDGVLEGLNSGWRWGKPVGEGERLPSTRAIILIGDNSAHQPSSSKNPKNITPGNLISIAKSKEKNVKIFSLCIKGGGDSKEQETHYAQFKELAEGAGGQCCTLKAWNSGKDDKAVADNVVRKIKDIVKKSSRRAEKVKGVLKTFPYKEGKPAAQVAGELGMSEEEYTEILEFLDDYIQVKKLSVRPGEVVCTTGWVLPEFDGMKVLKKKVFLGKMELHALCQELFRLQGEAVTQFRDVPKRAWKLSWDGHVDPQKDLDPPKDFMESFFDNERVEMMAAYLAAHKLPVNPKSVLNKTLSCLRTMPETDLNSLLKQVSEKEELLRKDWKEKSHWFRLGDDQFCWIDEEHLP